MVPIAAGAIGVAAVLVGWAEGPPSPPALDADGARRFTVEALDEVGYPDAAVAEEVTADDLRPQDAEEPVPVWRTTADVEGVEVGLAIDREAGRAIELQDVGPEGNLLSDEQFNELGRFRLDHDDRRDWFVERGATTAAGLALALVALAQWRWRPAAG